MDHNPRVFSLCMWEHLRKILSANSSDFPSCSDSGFHGVNLAIAARKTSRTAPPMQRFLITWGKLGNRCRECPGLALLRAVIHDFRGSIWESLQENPLEQPYRCSDSRFQAQTWESLQVFPKKQPKGCSDS